MKRVAVLSCLLGIAIIFTCERNNPRSYREDTTTSKPTTPPGAEQFIQERNTMVNTQIAPESGRPQPVTQDKVLEAMRTVPRHLFVPPDLADQAYVDSPLPIGYDQTISQPYIVAKMTELLQLHPHSRILEIGTGSGYQAAVLAQITPHVYTIEIIEPLGQRADQTLCDLGYNTIQRKIGDGYKGWPKAAPFDGIIVTCAAEKLPEPLWKQLKPGGRIVIPIGAENQVQKLVIIEKTEDGKRETEIVMLVRFVPMTGEAEKD